MSNTQEHQRGPSCPSNGAPPVPGSKRRREDNVPATSPTHDKKPRRAASWYERAEDINRLQAELTGRLATALNEDWPVQEHCTAGAGAQQAGGVPGRADRCACDAARPTAGAAARDGAAADWPVQEPPSSGEKDAALDGLSPRYLSTLTREEKKFHEMEAALKAMRDVIALQDNKLDEAYKKIDNMVNMTNEMSAALEAMREAKVAAIETATEAQERLDELRKRLMCAACWENAGDHGFECCEMRFCESCTGQLPGNRCPGCRAPFTCEPKAKYLAMVIDAAAFLDLTVASEAAASLPPSRETTASPHPLGAPGRPPRQLHEDPLTVRETSASPDAESRRTSASPVLLPSPLGAPGRPPRQLHEDPLTVREGSASALLGLLPRVEQVEAAASRGFPRTARRNAVELPPLPEPPQSRRSLRRRLRRRLDATSEDGGQ